MSDTPYTPGPWEVTGHDEVYGPAIRPVAWKDRNYPSGQGGAMAAVERGSPSERFPAESQAVSDANARLIASAPEMAELLVEARHLLHGEYCTRTYCDDEAHGAIDVLLARIHGQDGETA